jgi:hypothetical protein
MAKMRRRCAGRINMFWRSHWKPKEKKKERKKKKEISLTSFAIFER